MFKWVKYGIAGTVGFLLVGGLIFGKDLASYVRTSASSVRSAVKEAVPIEFELQRARDTVEQIVPEVHANIRLIAQGEVEIAAIKDDIRQSAHNLDQEQRRIQKLAELLSSGQSKFTLQDRTYSRETLKEELARRFEAFKEAQDVLKGKERLLDARQQSLQAALQMLDRTRTRKTQLETQIALLESKYRTIKASGAESGLQIDNSKLAQSEKILSEIKKRLDVAERVLTHESKFTQPIPLDVIDEKDLLARVREHFSPAATQPATTLPQHLE